MYRIIDANLNRATEALRVLEEIVRFRLDDKKLSSELKNIRHEICLFFDCDYEKLIASRDTVTDIGTDIQNPTKAAREQNSIEIIFRSNFKRLEQSYLCTSYYIKAEDSSKVKSLLIEKKQNLENMLAKYAELVRIENVANNEHTHELDWQNLARTFCQSRG